MVPPPGWFRAPLRPGGGAVTGTFRPPPAPASGAPSLDRDDAVHARLEVPGQVAHEYVGTRLAEIDRTGLAGTGIEVVAVTHLVHARRVLLDGTVTGGWQARRRSIGLEHEQLVGYLAGVGDLECVLARGEVRRGQPHLEVAQRHWYRRGRRQHVGGRRSRGARGGDRGGRRSCGGDSGGPDIPLGFVNGPEPKPGGDDATQDGNGRADEHDNRPAISESRASLQPLLQGS